MILEINNLNVFYDDVQVLKNINLNIEKNTIVSIIGSSGCGKTTLLKSLNRMNDFEKNCKINGEIKFNDENIYDQQYDVVELRKKIGMVFQTPNPFKMSISKNVVYGLKCQGVKNKVVLKEAVERCLKEAVLWDEVKDKLDKNAFKLSGGQQQRLCVARVLAINPDVILMDEPTSALDPISGLKIEKLLEQLKKDYTIILVTHSLNQAKRISDYVGFIYQGELIEYALTSDFFNSPKHELTKQYLSGEFD